MRARAAWAIVLVAAGVLTISVVLAARGSREPTLDRRALEVGRGLACPVCEGESVADSPSAMAAQMRASIREQLAAGRSSAEVVAALERRYGPDVSLRPPARGAGLLAWAAPVVVLLAGGLLLGAMIRRGEL